MKTKLIVILGPTATGKSDLAVKIAKQINGEIISADSRQVYKGMNIGTGKITKAEMHGIPHYLLDVANPKKVFTVADYVRLGEDAINNIVKKNKVPIICGGTGFYIQALIDGLILPEVPPDKELRLHLEKMSDIELLARLKKVDQKRYKNIDRHNIRRIIRAIEIATMLGKVPPLKIKSKYEPFFIGLKCSNEILKERIHKRLINRINDGMIDEVRELHLQGLIWKRLEDLGLEYRYISRFLRKVIGKSEMIEQLEMAICQYAKRQITWFKRDKRINWLSIPVNDNDYKSILDIYHKEISTVIK